jgi:hypothetical protein
MSNAIARESNRDERIVWSMVWFLAVNEVGRSTSFTAQWARSEVTRQALSAAPRRRAIRRYD